MYNVFKRPMFKRGGSTQGTGIMSHVERRPNYSIGGGVIQGNPMGSRTGFAFPGMEYYGEPTQIKTNLAQTPYGPQRPVQGPPRPTGFQRVLGKYPRVLPLGAYGTAASVGTGIGALVDFYAKSTYTPEGYKRLKEMSGPDYAFDETATSEDMLKAQEYIDEGRKIGIAPGFFPRGGKKKFYDDRKLSAETGLPRDLYVSPTQEMKEQEMAEGFAQAELDRIVAQKEAEKEKEKAKAKAKDSSYKESEQTEVQKEIEVLNEVLGPSISTAEKALLIGKAISSEGSIADKLDVARNEGLKLARQKRKQDRDIALTAYKVAKEKDIAKIKADQPTGTQRAVREFAMLGEKVKAGTASTSEKAIYNAYEKGVFKDDSDAGIKALAIQFAKTPDTLTEYQSEIKKLSAIKDRNKREEEKLQTAIKNYTIITNVLREGGYGSLYGLKEGGRVMKQIGGDAEGKTMEQNNLEVTETSGESNAFPTKPVEKLSFAELRDRLPGEITNDIVQLIANSADALQDFSYIRTQKDINDFNLKYGVNLILPPQKS